MYMYAFVMWLDERKFDSFRSRAPHRVPQRTGAHFTVAGKSVIVLGTGLTRAEAKAKGTDYYNRLCKWHGEEVTDWNFQTQDVGASAPESPSSDQERVKKRKAEEPHEDSSRKHRKR